MNELESEAESFNQPQGQAPFEGRIPNPKLPNRRRTSIKPEAQQEDSGSRSPLILSEHYNNPHSAKLLLHISDDDDSSSGMLSRLNLELNEIEKKLKNDFYIDESSDSGLGILGAGPGRGADRP